MARKKDPPPQQTEEQIPLKERLPSHKILPMALFAPGDGMAVELAKLNEIGSLLWFPKGISQAEKNAKLDKVWLKVYIQMKLRKTITFLPTKKGCI